MFLRFPHLGEHIFELLDTESLTNCFEIDTSWNEFISTQKFPWIRMLKEYVQCSEPWYNFFKKSKIEMLKVIAKTMPENYDDLFPKQGSPLTYAAMSGDIEVVSWLLEIEMGKQPEDEYGRTPLSFPFRNL